MRLGPIRPVVFVADLKLTEFLLSSNKFIEKSIDYRFLGKWLKRGLLTSTGGDTFVTYNVLSFLLLIIYCRKLLETTQKNYNTSFPFQYFRALCRCLLSSISEAGKKTREGVGQT